MSAANGIRLLCRRADRPMRKSRFLMATANSTFRNKEYVVEVGTSKRPIKAVFRETAKTMLIGLVLVWHWQLWVASFLLSVRFSRPKDRSGGAGSAGDSLRRQGIKAGCCPPTNRKSMRHLERNARPIGGLLPNWRRSVSPEAFTRGAISREEYAAELADFFAKERLSIRVTQTLLGLLKETERVSDIFRNLAASSRRFQANPRSERLRFYLAGLVASKADHVCLLTKHLGADLVLEARATEANLVLLSGRTQLRAENQTSGR